MMMEMLTDWPMGTIFGTLMIAFVVFLLLLMAGGVYSIADRMKGEYIWLAGTVAEKSYTPESSSTGVGVGPDGRGGVTTVVTSSYEDAKWSMLVDLPEFDTLTPVEVAPSDYKRTAPGSKIKLRFTRGGFSGTLHGPDEYKMGAK